MFLSFLFSNKDHPISGKWIDTDASPDGAQYGFILLPGGGAKSVNAASPQYTAWRRSGMTLTLWGRANNYNAAKADDKIDFIESLKIHRITRDTLVLSRAEDVFVFNRG